MGGGLLKLAAVLAAALAGCYSPSVDRCIYACGANRSCPQDLTCNTDNMCATSASDRCDDAGDGGIDAPDEMTPVTVTVVDARGMPIENIPVHFTTVGGALLSTQMTDSDGTANATVPIGSAATIDVPYGMSLNPRRVAATYTDLWPHAAIRYAITPPTGSGTVSFSVTRINGYEDYTVLTSCGVQGSAQATTGTSLAVSVEIPSWCTTFDAFAIAKDNAATPMVPQILGVANRSPTQSNVSGVYHVMKDLMLRIANVPPAATAMTTVAINPYLDPARSFTGSANLGLVDYTGGSQGGPMYIADVGFFVAHTADVAITAGGVRQDVLLHLAGTTPAGTLTGDISGKTLPVPSVVTADLANRAVTWSDNKLGSTADAPVALVRGEMLYSVSPQMTLWRVFSPGSRIQKPSTSERKLVYPAMPSSLGFLPDPTTTPIGGSIMEIATDGSIDVLREDMSRAQDKLGMFLAPNTTFFTVVGR